MTVADDALADLVAELADEQQTIVSLVRGIGADDWFRPTPAWGWDVRDTIAHLAHTDELAVDTCIGGPRALSALGARCASPEDLTYLGVLEGRRRSGHAVLEWWERARVTEHDVLLGLDPAQRVPWGLGMRPPSFVTARMMETWAHGLDVHAALGVEPTDTDRLRHVAWIGVRALPYAYSVAGLTPPEEPLRVEVTLPSGATWSTGPLDAPDRIAGPAGQLCRVLVQRLPASSATDLVAEGDAARLALRVARSFL